MLEKEDCTLGEILAEEDLIQECKAINPNLIALYDSSHALPHLRCASTQKPPLLRESCCGVTTLEDVSCRAGLPLTIDHTVFASWSLLALACLDLGHTSQRSLKKPDVVDTLIGYLIVPAEEGSPDEVKYKLPYLAYEIFFCEVTEIIDAVFEVEGLVSAASSQSGAPAPPRVCRSHTRPVHSESWTCVFTVADSLESAMRAWKM